MINEFTSENPDPENSTGDASRKRVLVQTETAKKSSKIFHSQSTQMGIQFIASDDYPGEIYSTLVIY